SDRRIAHRHLALSLAGVSLPLPRRSHETAFRRSNMAWPDGARLSLLDPAATDTPRVVRGAAAACCAPCRNGRSSCNRARRCLPHLAAATPTRCSGLGSAPIPVDDFAHRQLWLFQFADDAALPVSIR